MCFGRPGRSPGSLAIVLATGENASEEQPEPGSVQNTTKGKGWDVVPSAIHAQVDNTNQAGVQGACRGTQRQAAEQAGDNANDPFGHDSSSGGDGRALSLGTSICPQLDVDQCVRLQPTCHGAR
jgi:hypothetical protein